jgi:hypothetical protein
MSKAPVIQTSPTSPQFKSVVQEGHKSEPPKKCEVFEGVALDYDGKDPLIDCPQGCCCKRVLGLKNI